MAIQHPSNNYIVKEKAKSLSKRAASAVLFRLIVFIKCGLAINTKVVVVICESGNMDVSLSLSVVYSG
jgi:hypothetical protein